MFIAVHPSIDIFLDHAKEAIPFDQLFRYFRFAVSIKAGDDFNHIVNESIWPVVTQRRIVFSGDSLCGRTDWRFTKATAGREDCPGCLHIGRGIAVRDIV